MTDLMLAPIIVVGFLLGLFLLPTVLHSLLSAPKKPTQEVAEATTKRRTLAGMVEEAKRKQKP